jgi:hypothetical protein
LSEFDLLQDDFARELMRVHGDPDAVEFDTKAGRQRFPAVVGRLRTEPVVVTSSLAESIEDRETCQLSVECPPSQLWIGKPVVVFRYIEGDPSVHDGQSFTVRSIDSYRDGWVTVQVWRESVVQIQRAGYEGARA